MFGGLAQSRSCCLDRVMVLPYCLETLPSTAAVMANVQQLPHYNVHGKAAGK